MISLFFLSLAQRLHRVKCPMTRNLRVDDGSHFYATARTRFQAHGLIVHVTQSDAQHMRHAHSGRKRFAVTQPCIQRMLVRNVHGTWLKRTAVASPSTA